VDFLREKQEKPGPPGHFATPCGRLTGGLENHHIEYEGGPVSPSVFAPNEGSPKLDQPLLGSVKRSCSGAGNWSFVIGPWYNR
jgi:hypothetical protein